MPTSQYIVRPPGEAAPGGELCEEQLRRGFRTLRFSPELERQYRRAVMAEAHWPVLVITISAIVIWSIFAGLDIVRLDLSENWPPAPDIGLLLAMRWACCSC